MFQLLKAAPPSFPQYAFNTHQQVKAPREGSCHWVAAEVGLRGAVAKGYNYIPFIPPPPFFFLENMLAPDP